MEKMTISVDPDLAEFIRSVAANNGISIQKYVNNLLEKAVSLERGIDSDLCRKSVTREFQRMKALMTMYKEYGAEDTEPRSLLKETILNALDGSASVPLTAQQWGLYEGKEDREETAGILFIQCRKLVKMLNEVPSYMKYSLRQLFMEADV